MLCLGLKMMPVNSERCSWACMLTGHISPVAYLGFCKVGGHSGKFGAEVPSSVQVHSLSTPEAEDCELELFGSTFIVNNFQILNRAYTSLFPVMHTVVLVNINLHTTFEVPSFTHSKHIIGISIFKTWSLDPDHTR